MKQLLSLAPTVDISCFRDILGAELQTERPNLQFFYFDRVVSEIDRKGPLINFQKEIDSSQ